MARILQDAGDGEVAERLKAAAPTAHRVGPKPTGGSNPPLAATPPPGYVRVLDPIQETSPVKSLRRNARKMSTKPVMDIHTPAAASVQISG